MKKEDVTAIIVYMLILAAAVIFGITVLQARASNSGMEQPVYIGYIIGAIVVAILLNATLLELGHLAGAKIGGYLLVSLNILGFCFYKNKEGKTKFKFSGFDGLSGETKIRPNPNAKKEPNPHAYLLGGTIFYLVEVIIVIVLYVVMQSITTSIATTNPPKIYLNVAYFFVIVAFIGGMMLIYNIIPFHLDTTTDGYRLTLVGNPKNRVAFNELLRVEYEISIGNSDVEIKTFDQITNFTADLNLNKVYSLLDKGKYDEAKVLLEQIIAAKADISEKVYIRSLAQIIFINMVTVPLEEAVAFVEKDVPVQERRLVTQDDSMVCIRSDILIEGLVDKSKSECMIAFGKVEKAYKRTPVARRPVEVKLFNEAVRKVIEANPKWGFEKYYLKEVEKNPVEKK